MCSVWQQVDNSLWALLLIETIAVMAILAAIVAIFFDPDIGPITAIITFGSLLIAISQGADSKVYDGRPLLDQAEDL